MINQKVRVQEGESKYILNFNNSITITIVVNDQINQIYFMLNRNNIMNLL